MGWLFGGGRREESIIHSAVTYLPAGLPSSCAATLFFQVLTALTPLFNCLEFLKGNWEVLRSLRCATPNPWTRPDTVHLLHKLVSSIRTNRVSAKATS